MGTEEGSSQANGDMPVAKGVREKLKNPDYRRKCLRTFFLGSTFMALGLLVGQRGPAFLDIQIITQTDVESASFFFTAGSIGYLAGSLIAGVIYDKLNKSVLLFGSVILMAGVTVATPWCSIYGLMIAAFCLSSVFGGSVDTAGNAELLRIWGKEGDVAMQFLHFSFAFGAVISPLMTEPFLTPNPEDEISSNASSPIAESTLQLTNKTDNSTVGLPLKTDVHYAYLICGVIILLTAIPMIMEWFKEKSQKRRQEKKDHVNVRQPLPFHMFLFVQLVLCFVFFLYCSIEDSFAAYLTTFVVKQLHWTKSSGAKVTSLFWASFTTGRFLGMFAIKLLSSVKLLVICSVTLIISMLGFMLASQHLSTHGVWVCASGAGFTMSAIFPTSFTWMEEELVRVTGRVASFILIASSSGTMVNPIVLGYLMQEVSNMWFAYLLLAEACLCFLVFIFLLALSRFYLQQHYAIRERTAEIVIRTLEIEVLAPPVDGHAIKTSTM